METHEPMMTQKEVCDFLNISRQTLYKIRKRGLLKGSRVATSQGLRFKQSDVEAFFASRLEEGEEEDENGL